MCYLVLWNGVKQLPDSHLRNGNLADMCVVFKILFRAYSASHSFSQLADVASLGILQSPRGERLQGLTFGPSGRQERLNCWLKNRR